MLAFSSSHHRELVIHVRAAHVKGIKFLLYLLHFLVVGWDTTGLASKIPKFKMNSTNRSKVLWQYNKVSYLHVWATSWKLVQAVVLQKVLESLGWIENGERLKLGCRFVTVYIEWMEEKE